MGERTAAWTSQLPEARIDSVNALGTERCRCGTHVAPGARCFEVRNTSSVVTDLVGGRLFCSVRCVRAFLLEALAEVKELRSGPTPLEAELREIYLDLSRTFETLGFTSTDPRQFR